MAQGVFPAGPLTPAPGGLFSVAEVTRHSLDAERWAHGPFGWDSDVCPTELILADFCTNTDKGVIANATGSLKESWPFGIVTNYECYTLGVSFEERRKRVIAQNEAGTQKAVERQLWSGAISRAAGELDVAYLTDNEAVNVGPGVVSVEVGIAKLEQAIADCGLGLEGVIHLTRQAAQIAGSEDAIRMGPDGVLRTRLGTPVVAGVGYDPDAVPAAPVQAPIPAPAVLGPRPDNQWGFATGPVYVHLGPVEYIGEDPEGTPLNVIRALAGRTAAVYWDSCCAAAVEMDTTP